MLKNTMHRGLFTRLTTQAGLNPIYAIELASANYTTRKNQPLRKPIIPSTLIWKVTEMFLDQHSLTIEEAWIRIWGIEPDKYFEGTPLDPHS